MGDESLLPLVTTPGPWRVHVDLRAGRLVANPDSTPTEVVNRLAERDIDVCIIDLDGATGAGENKQLIQQLLKLWPGRFWVGGGIRRPSDLRAWQDDGAKGVVVGSSLFPDGVADPAVMRGFASAARDGHALVSVDVLDDMVVSKGFTKRTSLPVRDALNAVGQTFGPDTPVLYVDAGASLRTTPPDLRALRNAVADHPELRFWYGGNLASWRQLSEVWAARCAAIVGRHYLSGEIGLRA